MTFHGGTVSEGTLLPEDLIPVFAEEYVRLGGDADKVKSFHKHVEEYHDGSIDEWTHFSKNGNSWSGIPNHCLTSARSLMDNLQWDLEELFDLLNDLAPEGYYFGAHEGDGADFGFWKWKEE